MDNTAYVIEFDFPEGKVWGGLCQDGGWGFAPQVETAHFFTDAMGARNALNHAFGESMREWGTVKAVSRP